jgi:hypothetical protein
VDEADRASVEILLASAEPSVRYRVRTEVLGHDPVAPGLEQLRESIRGSARVAALLSERDDAGRIPWHPYSKWCGAHWVLAELAALAYPEGDGSLVPLREQALGWLLGPDHQKRIVVIAGKTRRCASQEGNALWSLTRLGLADERCEVLARSLIAWQWPDGGWNCDRRPEAVNSSFMETLIPMRALDLYGRQTGAIWATDAARRAAEVFLARRLYKRRRDGEVIDRSFVALHYPCYWHYDILFGLKALAEMGLLGDDRCRDALELLDGKRLPAGGWPAEAKYWSPLTATAAAPAPARSGTGAVADGQGQGRGPAGRRSGVSTVGWGPTGKTRLNEWVTLDALVVRRAAPG